VSYGQRGVFWPACAGVVLAAAQGLAPARGRIDAASHEEALAPAVTEIKRQPLSSQAQSAIAWSTDEAPAALEDAQRQPQAIPTASLASLQDNPAPSAKDSAKAAAPKPSPFDAALVARGNAAFQNACTQCHDAERSTSKSKSLAAWRGTVRRMAGKSGADVPQSDWEAIATYLASLNAPAAATGDGAAAAATAAPETPEQQFALWATFSPTWRAGNDHMELPGFFPQTWVGVNWQSKSALSARATACVTCHTEPGNAHRVELVEAAMRVDLMNLACGRDTPVKAVVDAGRFVVPFGAFSSQVNPGVYRTVALPLIFTM